MSEESKDRVQVDVARVCCDKCRGNDFLLYRKMKDPLNYFLVCKNCGHSKEFRVFLIWPVEVKFNFYTKEEMPFEKVFEDTSWLKDIPEGRENP
jgi:hypothetical protein